MPLEMSQPGSRRKGSPRWLLRTPLGAHESFVSSACQVDEVNIGNGDHHCRSIQRLTRRTWRPGLGGMSTNGRTGESNCGVVLTVHVDRYILFQPWCKIIWICGGSGSATLLSVLPLSNRSRGIIPVSRKITWWRSQECTPQIAGRLTQVHSSVPDMQKRDHSRNGFCRSELHACTQCGRPPTRFILFPANDHEYRKFPRGLSALWPSSSDWRVLQ